MTRAPFDVLELSAEGCDAEVWFNDIPLLVLRQRGCRQIDMPVNHLTLSPKSTISAIVEPGPTPATALEGQQRRRADGMSLTARLVRYPFGSVAGSDDGEELFALRWAGSGEQVFPLRVSAEGEVPGERGGWRWTTGEPLSPAGARDGALAYLARVHRHLAGRQLDALWAEARPFNLEIAAAFGVSAAVAEAEFRRQWEDEFVKPAFAMRPLDPDEVELRGCGGGRLVQPLRRDWGPVLRTAPDGEGNDAAYPLILGRRGGVWGVYA